MPVIATLAAVAQGLQIISSILSGGTQVYANFKVFLAQNNIKDDTDKLDEIILDAEMRKAAREAEVK